MVVAPTFSLIADVFANSGISPDWLHSLRHGTTTAFSDGKVTGIVSLLKDDSTLIINSATEGDVNFSREMLRFLRAVIKDHQDVNIIIQSTNEGIAPFMNKVYGFIPFDVTDENGARATGYLKEKGE